MRQARVRAQDLSQRVQRQRSVGGRGPRCGVEPQLIADSIDPSLRSEGIVDFLGSGGSPQPPPCVIPLARSSAATDVFSQINSLGDSCLPKGAASFVVCVLRQAPPVLPTGDCRRVQGELSSV